MITLRRKPEQFPGLEEIYFSYYERLFGWALQLTGQDRADAEDLVHDLYILLMRSGARLEQAEKQDAYLFAMLRNLHYARLRRAGRSPVSDLSIIDFDSIELGLASLDRRKLLHVRSSLKTVCEFACERKKASRTASILILRFFFGYYPSEVMKMLQMTRGAVDRSLQVARDEVRLHLERPGSFRSIMPDRQRSFLATSMWEDSYTLFGDLHQAIFRSCEGDCLGKKALAERYERERRADFTTAELAHLVSCARCLDDVNSILSLPLLADRSPDDTLGRDNSQGPGGGSPGPVAMPGSQSKRKSATKNAVAVQIIQHRMREVFEHRPRVLQIAVNGKLRASQKVTAELNELHLKLGRSEKPAFIEVLSEQNIRIAYLHVFDPAQHLGLEQREQVLLSDERQLDLALSHASDVPTVCVVYRDPVVAEIDAAENLRVTIKDRHVSGYIAQKASLGVSRVFTRVRQQLSSVRYGISHLISHMNPTLATALVLATASILCFLVWLNQPPRMSANAFLVRAEAWDKPQQKNAAGVIYQKVSIQTPKRTVERAIYRDIAGIRIPRKHLLDAADAQLKEQLAQAGVDWDAPLSAGTYQQWHDRQPVREDDVSRVGGHLLKLTTTLPEGAVEQVSLTVRESDFHPVVRTVELRDQGTIEIAELNYDVMPWGAVNPDWFEPVAVQRKGMVSDTHAARLPRLSVPLSGAELDEAELAVRLALHQLDADTNERVELARMPASIQVTGIVASDERKHEIAAHLQQIPHVSVALYSFQEIQNRQEVVSGIERIKQSSSVERPSPLEDYLLPQGITRDRIGELEHELFNSSVDVNHEGKAIGDLLKRFPSGQTLTANANGSLRQLLASHREKMAAALRAEQNVLRQANLPLERNAGSMDGNSLIALAETNAALCGELISDSSDHPRSVQSILPELVQSMAELQAILNRLSYSPSISQSPSSSTSYDPQNN